MGTAKKLPGNIAKRWKENKQKNSLEESRWKDIESKSSTMKAMIDIPSGKRAMKAKVSDNSGENPAKKNKKSKKVKT
jgi:hypothetical protein